MAIFLHSFESPLVVSNVHHFNADFALLFNRHGKEEVRAGQKRNITGVPRPSDQKVVIRAYVKSVNGRDETVCDLQRVQYATEHTGGVESDGFLVENGQILESKSVDETCPDIVTFRIKPGTYEVIVHDVIRFVPRGGENFLQPSDRRVEYFCLDSPEA